MAPRLHVSARLTGGSRRGLRLAGGCAGLALLSACAAGGGHGGGAVARGPTTQYYVSHASHDYTPPGPPGDPWGPYIDEASARFDVPTPWIRSVMHVESGGHEYIDGQLTVSYAGAMGLMQLEPGTYQEMASRYGLGGDPFNPYDNIMAGTAYIHEMYQVYGAPGFLAAYNAGPGRLDQFINYNEALPDATNNYVAMIAPNIEGYYPHNRSEADQLALNTEPAGTSTGILPPGYAPDAPRLPDPDSGSHDMMLAMNTVREQPAEAPAATTASLVTGNADDSADAENAVAAQQVAARAASMPQPAAAPAPVEVASIAPVQAAPLQVVPLQAAPVQAASTAQAVAAPAAPVQMAMAETGSALGAGEVPSAPQPVAAASPVPAVAATSLAPASVAPVQMASLGSPAYTPAYAQPVLQQAAFSPAASASQVPHYLPGAPHAYPNFSSGGEHHFSLIPSAMADTPSPALSGGEGGWAVQVGAYDTPARAHEALGMAETGAMRAPMGGQPTVVAAHLAGGTKYRARITNLPHGDAVDACSRLAGGRTGCVVLSPEAQS